jgi:hypothetical protein
MYPYGRREMKKNDEHWISVMCEWLYHCCYSMGVSTFNRIILANGDVIFARGINLFTWEIGQTYEITVETYSDRFGYVAPKILRDVKEV